MYLGDFYSSCDYKILFSKIMWEFYFDSEDVREPVISSNIENDVCGNMVNKVRETQGYFFINQLA